MGPVPEPDEVSLAAIYLLSDTYGVPAGKLRALLGIDVDIRAVVDGLQADPLGGDRPTAGPAGDPIRAAVDAATRRTI